MNKYVGWTFMSTESEPALLKILGDFCSCIVLENQHRPGGHKCPPYGVINELF